MTQGWLVAAIDVTATIFWVLRLAAGIGGALVAWFATGPVIRVLYRVALRRAAPGWMLPWARLGGAGLAGWLIFYFLPLGGGSGFGWGAGAGGGPGRGPGDGSAKANGQATKTDKTSIAESPKRDLEALEIELLGGKRFQGQDRYYLIQRKEPAVTFEDVKAYFMKHEDRLAQDVTIVLTPESVAEEHGAILRLKGIIEKYKRTWQVKNVDTVPVK
jgi:hypothetical protein